MSAALPKCHTFNCYFRFDASREFHEKHPNLTDSCQRVVFAINYQPRTGEKNRARLDEHLLE